MQIFSTKFLTPNYLSPKLLDSTPSFSLLDFFQKVKNSTQENFPKVILAVTDKNNFGKIGIPLIAVIAVISAIAVGILYFLRTYDPAIDPKKLEQDSSLLLQVAERKFNKLNTMEALEPVLAAAEKARTVAIASKHELNQQKAECWITLLNCLAELSPQEQQDFIRCFNKDKDLVTNLQVCIFNLMGLSNKQPINGPLALKLFDILEKYPDEKVKCEMLYDKASFYFTIQKDQTAALTLYDQCIAHAKENSWFIESSNVNKGLIFSNYFYNDGVEEHYQKAMEFFEPGVSSNDKNLQHKAKYSIARLLLYKHPLDSDESRRALSLVRELSIEGHDDSNKFLKEIDLARIDF